MAAGSSTAACPACGGVPSGKGARPRGARHSVVCSRNRSRAQSEESPLPFVLGSLWKNEVGKRTLNVCVIS